MSDAPAPGRVTVVGLGLIGGSIAVALRERGWTVSGADSDPSRVAQALAEGIVDTAGVDPASDISFVATPVGTVPEQVGELLSRTSGVVTDVGSVKASVAEACAHARFVGGHPMAGSEQEGLAGARADMFDGALWVLTPTAETDDESYAMVRSVVASVGADVVTLGPRAHDELVAVVSHVPHLTAATLMRIASHRSDEHRALLRLAAGGFRDMTRIAAGHPGIWPDICVQNREAIVGVLDELIRSLESVRSAVEGSDRETIAGALAEARAARLNLPARSVHPDRLTEVRVPIPDEKGQLKRVAGLAGDLDVNLYDIEIAHTAEGDRGVLIMLVDTAHSQRFEGGLLAMGYRPRLRPLT